MARSPEKKFIFHCSCAAFFLRFAIRMLPFSYAFVTNTVTMPDCPRKAPSYLKKCLHFPFGYDIILKLSIMDVSRYMPRHHKSNSPREVITMGKFCEVCEKGLMTGHNVSHSNRKSSRTWAPNVQKVRVLVEGRPMRLNVCTRCLRSGYVQRALPTVQNEVTEET